MKRYVMAVTAAVAVLGFWAVNVRAEDEAPKGKAAAGLRAGALNKLNLSDDQKAKVKEILKAARDEAQKADSREAKVKALQDAFEKIKTDVLTDEQRKQIEDLKGDLKTRFGGGEGALQAVMAKLGLTDEQKAKVKEILQAAKADAEKAEGLEAKAKVMKDALEKIKTDVLTDEQRKQLEDLKGKLGGLGEKIRDRVKNHAGADANATN